MVMATPIDLTFKVHDKVRFLGMSTRCDGEILSIQNGEATVRWKSGPRYDDWTQSEVALGQLRFACHNHGAPFESKVLDEEGMQRDGYCSGLALGLSGRFYQAGGPGGVKLANGRRPCRHLEQYDEFDERNNRAWLKGWSAGQKDARMKKPLDFTKAIRIVKDQYDRVVHVVGETAPGSGTYALTVGKGNPPKWDGPDEMIVVDQFGSPVHAWKYGYGLVFENVPQPISHGYVVDTHAGPVAINVTSMEGTVIKVEWVG